MPIAGKNKLQTASASAANEASVIDMFGREVNANGIELVDWQGYLANPYIKLTVKPPVTASYPVTITLNAKGSSRLMMDLPSTVSATGASKTLTFASSSEQKDFKLEIHPDRVGGNGEIENYTLSLNILENGGANRTQTIPIRVTDQDDNAESTLPLLFDYRFDTITKYFSDPGIKAAAERAIKDWFYFFDMASFDTVATGAETNHVPNDNFNGNTNITNNVAYNGEWIILRGLNDPYSTGWPSANGLYRKRNGVQVPGPIHRSIGTVLDFFPNFSAQTSLNDDEWYLTQNDSSTCTTSCATDVYSVIMHEFGHGLVFSSDWAGVAAYKAAGGTDSSIVSYQGNAVPLDSSYHIPADQQYWDRLSGQNGGRTHFFPSKRWMLTKLTLLIAEKAGWKLNKNLTPFLAPSIVTSSLPNGTKGSAYSQTLTAKGGVPFYDWNVTVGTLPPGLTLDRFKGTISGTVSSSAPQNSYTFTVQLRDYDTMSTPVTKSFTINLGGTTPPTDVVAQYLFNETSGTTGADASGNGKTATLSGGITWAAGHAANSVNFNGTNGYGSLPTGIVSGLNDFTIASWVKVNNTSNWTRIFDFGTGTSTNMFLTPRPGGAGLRFSITTSGSGGEQQISTSTAFPTGVWKHVAVTLSGTTGTLYVDGVQVATNASMTLKPSSLGNTNLNYLGRSQYSGDAYLNGGLDDFRIYNRALSATEISALFNS
nr:LamG-like jellyroll fold domain-containing protein [Cohnella endophytica]